MIIEPIILDVYYRKVKLLSFIILFVIQLRVCLPLYPLFGEKTKLDIKISEPAHTFGQKSDYQKKDIMNIARNNVIYTS